MSEAALYRPAEARMAVAVGFEPTEGFPSHAFEACSFGRSDTPPRKSVAAQIRRRRIASAPAAVMWDSDAVSRWDDAMREAMGVARTASAAGDVPIGAVLLDADGVVVAAAGNEREQLHDPTAHAEVLVLRRRAEELGTWRLDGHTLVVTLEPCTMCAGASVLARVERIVFGAYDPKAGAISSLWDVVRDPRLNHRPQVVGGILADECGALLAEFFAERR